MADRPATRGKRFVKLAGMTASVFGRYAKTKVKSLFLSDEAAEIERRLTHELSGGRIAKTLGELKGAVMKVGQMVSIASDVLPSELADALRSLQREDPGATVASCTLGALLYRLSGGLGRRVDRRLIGLRFQ